MKERGCGVHPATAMLILLHPDDFEISGISSWRANVEVATNEVPKWHFIPSALMPEWISNETVHGPIPNADYNNLEVWGSYGGGLVIKS
ncbi:hypothetical protein [Mycobacterium marinum]|uniref:hypothetical protein n=1 Tax=Mycobacterium marinum TaxID=1781 RepID=UPI003568E1B8